MPRCSIRAEIAARLGQHRARDADAVGSSRQFETGSGVGGIADITWSMMISPRRVSIRNSVRIAATAAAPRTRVGLALAADNRVPPTLKARTGSTMFLNRCSPRAVNVTGSLVPSWSRTAPERQIPPGSASACSRAVMLTPSPKRLSPSTITSPRCTPIRNRIRSPAGRFSFSLAIVCCTAMAHSTASTALAKSARMLSPRC
jgi:hypothetical protein